jgi:hypothetical protein
MVISRTLINPGLDWVVSASEREMLEFLSPEISCPRCGNPLRRDSANPIPTLSDQRGHRFSNIRALVVELYQRGMLRPKGPLLIRSRDADHSAA